MNNQGDKVMSSRNAEEYIYLHLPFSVVGQIVLETKIIRIKLSVAWKNRWGFGH